jgi:hypothetical protein
MAEMVWGGLKLAWLTICNLSKRLMKWIWIKIKRGWSLLLSKLKDVLCN